MKKPILLVVVTLLVMTAPGLVPQVPDIEGRVVYISDRSGSENIWVLDLKTQENRKISVFPGEWGITGLMQPQWSQDGGEILFAGWTDYWKLFVMNADGTNIRQLTSGARVEYFRWDPIDKNRVYYNYANSQFHRLNIVTGIDEPIPNPPGTSEPTTFDITSDGSEIMFTRQSTYGYQSMVEPASQRIIKPYEGRRSYATRINRIDGWICYWESSTDPCMSWDTDIWKISPDGTTRVQLTHVVPGAEYNYLPSWGNGPNDGYIFFSGNHFGNHEVCLMKADGVSYPDGIINLTNNPASDREPDWTPVGTNVNKPPVANAGENISVKSINKPTTTIQGTASDLDQGDTLQYRWKEGNTILWDWTNVGEDGKCLLNLASTSLYIGSYTLTLEVTDAKVTASDDMILTIENSAPNAAPMGGGVYEINSSVILGGNVSDYDGDSLTYKWLEGQTVLFEDTLQTVAGGEPVALPNHSISTLNLGTHTITLQVSDGINTPVSSSITVQMVDSTVPTLAPVSNQTILWPANHKMVDITINANAADNSGQVTLAATVSSNEPIDGLGDGDQVPDWTEPVINQQTGIITFQLRAERSGTGNGRIYTITISATDNSNNTSTTKIEIIVPHDMKRA